MSFSTPNAYGISRLSARIVTHKGDGGVNRWLELRFVDKYTCAEDTMAVHFGRESDDKFTKLAYAINEIFGENTAKEQISEV